MPQLSRILCLMQGRYPKRIRGIRKRAIRQTVKDAEAANMSYKSYVKYLNNELVDPRERDPPCYREMASMISCWNKGAQCIQGQSECCGRIKEFSESWKEHFSHHPSDGETVLNLLCSIYSRHDKEYLKNLFQKFAVRESNPS